MQRGGERVPADIRGADPGAPGKWEQVSLGRRASPNYFSSLQTLGHCVHPHAAVHLGVCRTAALEAHQLCQQSGSDAAAGLTVHVSVILSGHEVAIA